MSSTFVPYNFSLAVIAGHTDKARAMLEANKDAIQGDPMLMNHVFGTIERNARRDQRAGLIQAAREAGLSPVKPESVRPVSAPRFALEGYVARVR